MNMKKTLGLCAALLGIMATGVVANAGDSNANTGAELTPINRKSQLYDPTVRIIDKTNTLNNFTGSFISGDTIVTSLDVTSIPIKNILIEPSLNGNTPFGTSNQVFEIVVKDRLAYIKMMNNDAGKGSGYYNIDRTSKGEFQDITSVGYRTPKADSTLYSMQSSSQIHFDDFRVYDRSELGLGSPIFNKNTNELIGVKVDAGPSYGADRAKLFNDSETFNYAVKMKDKKPAVAYNKQVSVKKEGYNIWQNYRWDGVRGTTTGNLGKVYDAKYIYKMENGSNYYSLYDAAGNWQGYLNTDATMNVEAKAFNKNVKITSPNYTLWRNFYFNAKMGDTKDKNGKTYEARYIYELGNGQKYYSMYDKGTWIGYLNTTGTNMK